MGINPPYSENHTLVLLECVPNVVEFGPMWEQITSRIFQWFAVTLSAAFLVYYVYSTYRATCGWEELYVCTVEFLKVILEIYFEYVPPAMIYQTNGQVTTWLRYGEWLLTCPVILIHLSNITGLNDEYSPRTMVLITSDLGGITMAITSALSVGWLKWVFFVIGVGYGISTFYNACQIYIESYYTMPAGKCKRLVVWMAIVFFSSWFMFPALFISGPEGTKALTWSGATIANTVADLLSKNTWGLIGHFLRVAIHEHILVHGDVRRPITVQVLGQEVSVSCFVEDEENEEDKRTSTSVYAKRDSFVKMKERMEERGITTRSSIEFDLPRVMDGSIILAVTDPMVLGFLQSEMSKMGATINVAPATGMVQLDTLLQKGGFDGLLIGPEFLQQEGIVPHIKNKYRVPVYAYGYTKMGPNQQLIESSGVDGWVEGPSFGTPFDSEGLANAIGQMQKLKGSYSVPSMPGMMGMMGAIPSMGSVSSMTSMPMMYGMQGVAAADPGSPSIYAGGVNMQMAQMQQNAFTGMQTPLRMQPPVGMQTPTGMQSPVGVPSGMKTPPMMAQEQMNLHMAQMQQMMAQMQQMQQQPQEISLVDQMKYMQSTQPFK